MWVGKCGLLLPHDLPRIVFQVAHQFLQIVPYFKKLIYLPGFPVWHEMAPVAFWFYLFRRFPQAVTVLSWAVKLIALAAWIKIYIKQKKNEEALFAASIILVFWITPHAMIYEWSVLLIPAALLWKAWPQKRKALRGIYALVWAAPLLSAPLNLLQQSLCPVVLHFGVLIWGLASVLLYRMALRASAR